MIISPAKRKILKITAYILGSIVVLLTIFHFWFIYHAERLIENMVETKSNGKLKLKVKKFKFNWFSYDMQLTNAVFYSADSNTASTSYRFSVDKLNIRVKEILPLVFEKKILIDSLSLLNPDIRVTKLRSSKDTTTTSDTTTDKNVSLPQEMGRVYNSINDALRMLQVNRFRINNGKFTLINKTQPDDLPVSISNIYFHLDNLQIDSSDKEAKQKILFSDNVMLRTQHQDIVFPDGRHRLSFSNFRINILRKMVEFDSCTISATKGDSSKSSFSVFFDKLLLTNIDFDTLYQKEVIKADSVYCINPRFKLDVEIEEKTGPRKPRPKLNDLIQQLTGDLQLAFVVVNNASFDINTIRDGNPSSFTSDHNNFEMQGLRIEKNSPKPLTVESFAMAIRNYENFLKDSTYSMQFDSVLFNNNNIHLSNFSIKQMDKGNVINNFSMPLFVLRGLSWDDLVFERKLTAEKASLYNPVINYSIAAGKNKKQDIFQVLAGIGDIIQLSSLDIKNGQINLRFSGGAQLQLENASVSVLSQSLVDSRRISNLQRSLQELNFKKGLFKLNDLAVRMENVNFTGDNGRLSAGKMNVTSKGKNLSVDARKVVINRMMIDNIALVTEIDGIQWQEADIKIIGAPGKKKPGGSIILKNIQGANTKLAFGNGNQKVNAFLQVISADEFISRANSTPHITNLKANGKNVSFNDENLKLAIDRFQFADHQPSTMQDLFFEKNTTTDSVSITVPSINLTPDLNAMINGAITADNILLVRPTIRVKLFQSGDTLVKEEKKLPEVAIGKLSIEQPEVYFMKYGAKPLIIEWQGNAEKNNSFELSGLTIKNNPSPTISANQFLLALRNFSITSDEKTFSTGKGSLNTRITGIHLDSLDNDQLSWRGVIADLHVKDILVDSMKNQGRLEISSARLHDLTVKSTSTNNFRKILKENTGFRLNEMSGKYDDVNKHYDWQNLNYDKTSKILSVDSFTYRPTPGKDSFMAMQPYQSDYITLSTGAVDIGPFDIDKYLTDTVLNAGTVNVSQLYLTDFRDMRKPSRDDIVKPLPVNLLKKIPVRLSLDTLYLKNTTIEYSELNKKTKQTGTITVDRLSAKVFNINNYDHQEGDSLHLDAQAWLMDSMWISLNLRESYTDSLAGFLMSVNMKPGDIRVLNPVLIPLASVKLESGYLDTLSMKVAGREYLSLGEMKMFYHDLKIRLVSNEPEKKKPFLKGIISFLANTLIIKNKNTSRTGVVFFERIRSKSTMNYLVKIALSGVASSVGAKSSKKRLRKYKKELRKRNLPAINYDMLHAGTQP